MVSTGELFELEMLLAIRLIVSRSDCRCCRSIPSNRCSDSRCQCFAAVAVVVVVVRLSAPFAVAGLRRVERDLVDVVRARLDDSDDSGCGPISGGAEISTTGNEALLGLFIIPFFREAKNSFRSGTFPTGRRSCTSNDGIRSAVIAGEGASCGVEKFPRRMMDGRELQLLLDARVAVAVAAAAYDERGGGST